MKFNLLLLILFCFNWIIFAQMPFTCGGEFYLSFYNVGATTTLNEVTINGDNTANFSPVGGEMPFRINSVGYRVTDNFIYGVHPSNNDLYRIDATGSARFLFEVDLTNNNNYVAGDVTPDGNYLVVAGKIMNNPSNEIVLIDLNSPTYQTTNIPLIDLSTGLPNSMVNIADIAFNPISGICYAYDSVNKRLVTIDIETGEINSTRYPVTTAAGIGALFFDPLGQLWGYGRYLSSALLEDLIAFDLDTGETTYITTGPSTNGIDGCSCPYTVDLGKTTTLDTVLQCGSFEIIYPISNLSGTIQDAINFVDTLADGFIIQQVLSNPFGGTISGIGTNQLNIDNMTLPLGLDSLIIRVNAPAELSGTFFGFAHLQGLPEYLGGTIFSDNPSTFQIDDATGITVVPLILELGDDIVICNEDEMITVGPEDLTTFNGFDFSWNTNETTPTINVNDGGKYILTLSKGTCFISDTLLITVNEGISLGNDTSICLIDLFPITANISGVTDQSYQWNDGSSNASILVSEAGTYAVTVTQGDCRSSDEIIISEKVCDCDFAVPNAFAPNGDGNNDVFRPIIKEGCEFISFQFSVFNRWGQLVYDADNETLTNFGWNGMINGESQPSDVYIWIINYKQNPNDPMLSQKGDVTLVR